MKTINWKATARTGDLMVNIRNYTSLRAVRIFLNLADTGILKNEQLVELCISIAARFAGELLEQGKIRTLADSRYALIEFLPGEDYSYIRDALGRVASFGYWPILAHVERYTNVINRMDKAVGLKEDTGCYFQVNAASITGEYGFTTKKVTRKLLREELVEFIATDAHRNEGKRSPKMKACAEWVEKKMGREKAEKIFRRNPEAILADQMM